MRARSPLRPPNAAFSLEEALAVTNADLNELTKSELMVERYRTQRVIARDPGRFVWLGPHTWCTAAQWGLERLGKIDALLGAGAGAGQGRSRRRSRPWVAR